MLVVNSNSSSSGSKQLRDEKGGVRRQRNSALRFSFWCRVEEAQGRERVWKCVCVVRVGWEHNSEGEMGRGRRNGLWRLAV